MHTQHVIIATHTCTSHLNLKNKTLKHEHHDNYSKYYYYFYSINRYKAHIQNKKAQSTKNQTKNENVKVKNKTHLKPKVSWVSYT